MADMIFNVSGFDYDSDVSSSKSDSVVRKKSGIKRREHIPPKNKSELIAFKYAILELNYRGEIKYLISAFFLAIEKMNECVPETSEFESIHEEIQEYSELVYAIEEVIEICLGDKIDDPLEIISEYGYDMDEAKDVHLCMEHSSLDDLLLDYDWGDSKTLDAVLGMIVEKFEKAAKDMRENAWELILSVNETIQQMEAVE